MIGYRNKFFKTSSKKVVHKTAEEIGESIGNKIADAAAKSNDDKIMKRKPVFDENPRNGEEIIISPEKREEILNELRQALNI